MAPSHWATQSPTTAPGPAATPAIALLRPTLPALRAASAQLVFHYRAGDFAAARVPRARTREINTRFAAPMLERVLALGEPDLARERPGAERTVGCCRDAVVLFLALARGRGVPARGRVGFAAYIVPGWWVDHVVAEVWEAEEGGEGEGKRRWRLVDPEMEESYRPRVGGGRVVDWLDVDGEREFLTDAAAWAAARAGRVDAERFVVAPQLMEPRMRSWATLGHNVVHDLASMNKTEMLLWDSWGMQARFERDVPEADALVLDEVSKALADPDVTPEVLAELGARDGLAIPSKVLCPVNPMDPETGLDEVDVSAVLGAA